MPLKGTATWWAPHRVRVVAVGAMRAAKGHCDAGRLLILPLDFLVGAMRAAKGHCDGQTSRR